jgi:hypothetical protein
MKSLPSNDPGTTVSLAGTAPQAKPGFFRRIKNYARQIRRDFFQPVPADAARTWWHKTAWRFTFLFKKYGWKILVALFLYYLIRDTTLYVVIPWLLAKRLIGH